MTPPVDPLPCFEALRGLGGLADLRPVIVTDTREQTPLTFTRLLCVTHGLESGDYSFIGGERSFAIERKSIQDLVACCTGANRERFERELCRLRGYRFKRLVVIGTPGEVTAQHYRGRVSPVSVLHTLCAFEARYDLPVVWTPTAEDAALQIESWVWWFSREMVRGVNVMFTGTSFAEQKANQLLSVPAGTLT